MSLPHTTVVLLMADDDADDRLLMRDALQECSLKVELRCVENGEELMDYLHRRGSFGGLDRAPEPHLILLDLNMPRIGGLEALEKIKGDPALRHLPVVILTTSSAPTDVRRSYDLGANSFLTKPSTFDGLVEAMQTLGHYWLDTVTLPRDEAASHER